MTEDQTSKTILLHTKARLTVRKHPLHYRKKEDNYISIRTKETIRPQSEVTQMRTERRTPGTTKDVDTEKLVQIFKESLIEKSITEKSEIKEDPFL